MKYRLVIFDWEGTLGDGLGRQLLPGALDFLTALRHQKILLAIATNKYDVSLQRDLEYFELKQWFCVTRCANQTAPKPHPLMLEDILYETQVPASESLMIGDSDADMAMAKTMNIDALGIDFYGKNRALLLASGAQEVFQDFVSMQKYLSLSN
jgi:phosphoglycolate phosphatase